MGRKVFLSILGTGIYGRGRYVDNNGFESDSTKFIQKATLQFIKASDWSEGDAVIIALTGQARKLNWNSGRELKNHEDEPYFGLCDELLEMNLPCRIKDIDIPNGGNEDEMWTIFTTVFDELMPQDELYIDLTHSFRYLPMLVLVLVDYAKLLKDVTVKSMTYGNWEARDGKDNAPIVNLLPLIALQNWTSSASELIRNGYPEAVDKAAVDSLKPLLRQGNCDSDIIAISNATKKLVAWVDQLRTCRGQELISAKDYRLFMEKISSVSTDSFPPLQHILKKLSDTFNESGFTSEGKITNCLSAARWCAKMRMWQSAITILQEGITSRLTEMVGQDISNPDTRDLVGQAFHYACNSQEPDPGLKYYDIIKRLMSTKYMNEKSFRDTWSKIQEIRNDFNHSGMRKSYKTPRKIIDNIPVLIDSAEAFFIDDGGDTKTVFSKKVFVNLSNHPSVNWSEKQKRAAENGYGEIVDMPFPSIDPQADPESVAELVDKCLNSITELSGDADVSVHIMGEMTFTFAMVERLKSMGIICVASTTERLAVENPDGSKTVSFDFVRFRQY